MGPFSPPARKPQSLRGPSTSDDGVDVKETCGIAALPDYSYTYLYGILLSVLKNAQTNLPAVPTISILTHLHVADERTHPRYSSSAKLT